MVDKNVYPVTPKQAVNIQNKLRKKLILKKATKHINAVAGVDVSVKNNMAVSAVVVMKYPGLEVTESQTAIRPVEFPYIPGLLAFRELPVILEAFGKITVTPDAVIVDGQGYAHPRRFGVACHLGVELDLPAIGCGKSRLVGSYAEPDNQRGASSDLVDKEEIIGKVVRTRINIKPVFISAGHRMDLDSAVSLALGCVTKYRLPEPIRAAHKTAGAMMSEYAP